jgi:hypothetical protein
MSNSRNLIRKTNIDKLNAWFANEGEPKAWAALIAEGLEFWTVERILSGQTECPRRLTRLAIMRATKMTEDELFPQAAKQSGKAAS